MVSYHLLVKNAWSFSMTGRRQLQSIEERKFRSEKIHGSCADRRGRVGYGCQSDSDAVLIDEYGNIVLGKLAAEYNNKL